MGEGLPQSYQETQYPHHQYGLNTTQEHVQSFVDQQPDAIHPGLVPHFENQGYDMTLVKKTADNSEWDFSQGKSDEQVASEQNLPSSKQPLGDEAGWDFSMPFKSTESATASTIDTQLSSNLNQNALPAASLDSYQDKLGEHETIKTSKFKAFLGKLAFKKTIEPSNYDTKNKILTQNVPFAAQHENGDPWSDIPIVSASDDAQNFKWPPETVTPFFKGFDGPNLVSNTTATEFLQTNSFDHNPNSKLQTINSSITQGELAGTQSEHKVKTQEKRAGTWIEKAPHFVAQLEDTSRTEPITYIKNTQRAMGTDTEYGNKETQSEHESINQLASFLKEVAQYDGGIGHNARIAQSMLENMTFIGKKEYDIATKGIADTWRQKLTENPALQLCAVTGQITPGMVKSDAYLLDNILKNFSDEDIENFGDRLITDPDELTAEPEDVNIIMLDDWTISGQQLESASANILRRYPEYKHSIEIQLLAATERRMKNGLNSWVSDSWNTETVNIPVNAYYAANAAPNEYAPYSGAHITGSHCAVDYDFNNDISNMAMAINKDMPPATNIVRPYRKPGVVLAQRKRLDERRVHRKINSDNSASEYVVPKSSVVF